MTSHGHGSSHSHATAATATGQHRRRLVVVLVITVVVMVVEVVGAVLSGSLALLADAGHMLTDAAGVGVALWAAWLATRPTTDVRTFGWQRAEILAALANGLLLAAVAVSVIWEGVRRLVHPEGEITAGLMVAAAVVGLVANVVSMRVLAGGKDESLNVRGAYLEVLGDLIGSVLVVVAGVLIAATGFERADGLASVLIGVLIAPRAWSLLRDVGAVLLEQTPPGVDLDRVREHMSGVPGVIGVHDLHAWTITSGVPVLSAHVEVEASCLACGEGPDVLVQLRRCLAGHFDVEHSTFQIEPPDMRADEPSAHA
jgi:cobalt-zinc-cadmium efflux system protein